MSPSPRSKSKDKKAAKESQKGSKSSGSGNASNGAAASAYNPLSGTFHALEMLSESSAPAVQTNGRFRNIDETDEHAGGSLTPSLEYDAVSNNGSWSGESEDHKEKASNPPNRTEALPGSDNDKREKTRQKNERKHQRQKERRAQELHERCSGYLMSRKLEALAQQIVQMGFPHERATMALILNEGRVAEAVAWLLEGGEDGEALKDKNIGGGNLKIDISDELAQIADMETRYHFSKQEVERVIVGCEGDLKKAAESLSEMRHETTFAPPKTEDTFDQPIVSNGKLSVASQNSRPQIKTSLSPIPLKKDERDFNYVKGVVTQPSAVDSGNKNGQPVKRIQSKMEFPKPQQSTALSEKNWTASGANPSVTHSTVSPLQVSASLGKTENKYVPAGGDYKSLPSTSVREPAIMMQRPQSVNAKQPPATSMSTSPPATAGNWYPTNGVDIVKPNGFLPQIPSTRSLSPNYLTTNQIYQQIQYQPQQFVPGSSSGEPQVSSRGNGLLGKTSTGPMIAAASSLGLFSGLGSTGTSGAPSPVDWSTAGSMLNFDYSNIDWSLDRGMSLPRHNMWIGLSPLKKNTAHVYDSDTAGVGIQSSMRSVPSNGSIFPVPGLQGGGIASNETPAAGSSREWSSPFEGKDLFSLPRQFVSSPSL